MHRPQARLNRYEKLLDRRPAETHGFGARLAGASRLARLRARERGVAPAVADVAAGVVAPVLISYVLWLASQARERGLSRLYFVSGDGEILLEVARPLLAVLAPEVECRYLYGSRQSQLGYAGAARRIALRGRGIPVNSWRAGTARLQKQPWRSVLLLRELEDRQRSLVRRLGREARLTAGRLRR